MTERVQIGFEGQTIEIGIDNLLPTRSVQPEFRKTRKFAQIRSSIQEIGLIEPLIVTPPDPASGLRMLLDGHLRLLAMRELGLATVSSTATTMLRWACRRPARALWQAC